MRLTVTCRVVETQTSTVSVTTNIGVGGVRFQAEKPLAPGTQMELSITVPDRATPIQALAEVVWSQPVRSSTPGHSRTTTDIGVRFLTIDPKDQALLRHYTLLYSPPPAA